MRKFSNNSDLGLLTQKTYNQVAESFTKSRLKRDKIVDLFFKQHKPQGKILDLGCGSGRDLRCLNEQYFFANSKNTYLGLDYSSELLKLARENAAAILRSKELKQVKFMEQDLTKLNIKENFDYILALTSLHHLEPKSHLKTLQLIQKLLKPNKKFVGYVWSPNKTQIPKWIKIGDQKYLKHWNGQSGPKMFIYLFKKSELENLLKKAGFINIKVKTVGQKIKKNLFFSASK
jgi:SAM-dependent methyltransferase